MLSIVIPFHNERNSIEPILHRAKSFIGRYDFELICVNDASKDDTNEIFNRLLQDKDCSFVKYINISPENHIGYGHAIMTGVSRANGEVIAWTHSDLQTDLADVFRAFDEFKEYSDRKVIVKGNRIARSFKDVAFSFGMACIASLRLGKVFYEINAQPKLFSRSFLEYLKNTPDDFSLDLYLLHQAKNNNFIIKTIDVRFEKRPHGQSSWANSFSSKWKTILRTIKYIWFL